MARPKTAFPSPSRMVPDPGPNGVASPNLSGSGVLPRLDVNAAMAPALGMAAVGEGLQRAGSAVSALAEKKREADAVIIERQASLLMKQANADISTAVASEADQAKWSGIAQERMDSLQGELQNLNVDPDTRKAIDYKYAANRIDVQGGLDEHAARKSFADAARAVGDTVKDAALSQDEALADHTITGAVERKLITPEQGRLLKAQFTLDVEQAREVTQKEQMLAAIQSDPEKALTLIKDPAFNVKPSVRAWGENAAQEGVREQRAGLSDTLINTAISERWTVPEQVDEWAKSNPKATPEQLRTTKLMVEKLAEADHKVEVEENSDVNIARARQMVRAYSYKDDQDLKKYDRIQKWSHTFLPQRLWGEVDGPLFRKIGRTGNVPEDPYKIKILEKALDATEAQGGAGPWGAYANDTEVPFSAVDVDGKTVQKKKIVSVLDPAAYARVQTARAKHDAYMRGWIRDNPKADGPAILTEYNRVLPEATLAGSMDALDDGPAQLEEGPRGSGDASGVIEDFMDRAEALGEPSADLIPVDYIPDNE